MPAHTAGYCRCCADIRRGGAAIALEMGIATVSRKLERLEKALTVPLFSRHQNGYRLTDDGQALMERAEALEHAGYAFAESAQNQGRIAGNVRLATAENLANPLIIPSLGNLFSRHPDLNIEIVSDVQTVNLHRRDADLAVRMVKPEAGNVTIKRLGTLGFGLYGSRIYLDTRHVGIDAAIFDNDAFIGWTESNAHLPAAKWITRILRDRPCKVETNTLSAQLAAATSGLGLAVLPHYLARLADLVCLLPEMGVDQPIWLVIHSDLAHSRRVRTVADHLIGLFEDKQAELNPVQFNSQ